MRHTEVPGSRARQGGEVQFWCRHILSWMHLRLLCKPGSTPLQKSGRDWELGRWSNDRGAGFWSKLSWPGWHGWQDGQTGAEGEAFCQVDIRAMYRCKDILLQSKKFDLPRSERSRASFSKRFELPWFKRCRVCSSSKGDIRDRDREREGEKAEEEKEEENAKQISLETRAKKEEKKLEMEKKKVEVEVEKVEVEKKVEVEERENNDKFRWGWRSKQREHFSTQQTLGLNWDD